jgi:trigger factor
MPKEDADEDAPEDEQVDFTVTVHGVKERRLPELDDEFARLVGQEYEDYSALKTAIHGQVAESKASGARRELEDNVIGEAVKGSGIEIPPQLVERQADVLLQRLARNLERQGLSVEQYLRFTGRGPEALRAELLSDAETNLSRSLVLDAIADAEQLVVSDEEVDAELALATSDSQGASSVSAAATAAVRERVRAAMRQTKTLRYLLDTAAPGAADASSGTTDQPAEAPAAEEEEAHV